MLTLAQLYQRTNARRKESAKYVKIIHQKRGWDSLGRGYAACASYSTKEWNPWKQKYVKNPRIKNRYVTVIVFLDPRLHVVVSCSCADFKYRWEVALNHAQAAEIEYSNGELPVVRNPGMSKWMCKHLLKFYETIKSELPKAKKNDKTGPIKAPEVGIPPSELKRRAEEERKKALEQERLRKLSQPKKPVHKTVKPGKKQSTAPKPQPQKPVNPPAMMKAPKVDKRKLKREQRKAPSKPVNPPAMMKAPSKPSKPIPQPQVKFNPPARITPTRTIKNRGF